MLICLKHCAVLLVWLAVSLQAADATAKNIILFLGDAGGIPTLNAAGIYAHKEPRRLFLHSMPYIGLSETSSASSWVTDSAAGMTAIVTGQKTHNGVISQSADAVRGKKDGTPLKTILEYAEERGLATGVVSNSSILSATPAACYAHVNDRKNNAGIFRHMLAPRFGDGVDVVMGAGRKNVLAAGREIGVDAPAALRKAGIAWYDSLDAVPAGAARAAVLFDKDFDLNAVTRRAIDILSRNPKGFFLMVESDLHTENVIQGLKRAAAFDQTIRETVERMKGSDTLILYTADHSYDFRVHDGRKGSALFDEADKALQSDDDEPIRLKNIRRDDDHTGEEVLVAAYGPGAERVRGFLANTDLFRIMLAAYGWDAAPQAAAAAPDAAAITREPDPARRLVALRKLLRPVRKQNLDMLMKLAESDPDAGVRRAIVDRLGRVQEPEVEEFLARRAASDADAGVALLALERLRIHQARRLGRVFEERLERARAANDEASLKVLIPESQRWASFARGAILPAFLQEAPPVFEAFPANKPLRALLFGDWGTGSEHMTKTALAARAYHRKRPFDIALTVGDNFPSDGLTGTSDPRLKGQWEDLYAPMGIPVFASTGNHDWGFADSPAAEILYTQLSKTWRMPALYYSYVAGPVQFFALGTQAMSDAQLQWLDRELARSKARWKIVYGHHPIYSHGEHGDTEGFDKTLLPILQKHKATAYIAGHEHTVQHLKPEGGVHLFVNAAGGQGARETKPGPRSIFHDAFYGFTVIEAGAGELKIGFVDTDGKTRYETKIQ